MHYRSQGRGCLYHRGVRVGNSHTYVDEISAAFRDKVYDVRDSTPPLKRSDLDERGHRTKQSSH